MFPHTNDPECQEYINIVLSEKRPSGICPTELNFMISELKESADGILKIYDAEGYLCPVCLVRMETVLRVLRSYQKDVDK